MRSVLCVSTHICLASRLVLTLRTVYVVGRDLGEGRLTLRAMSLHSL
jgi:hypothetical protein